MKKIIFILFLAIITVSCNLTKTSDPDNIIARVYDDYLFSSDLTDVIPKDASVKDSLTIVKNYINNWVSQKLLVNQAEENLSYEQKDFTKQMESYRNSLIIYKYQTLFVNQRLDTVVNQQEIEDYYNSNKKIFKLKNDIVKANYIILDKDSPERKKFRKYLKIEENYAIDSLEKFCKQSAIDYYLDNENWIFLDELSINIPINSYEYKDFLRNHKLLEIENSSLLYFVKFFDLAY